MSTTYSIPQTNALVNGLGGSAGFGEGTLARNDDYYTSAIDLTTIFPNGLNFFGVNLNKIFVNNNGNVTFDSGWYTYTPPTPFNHTTIVPFWADVDTRGGAGSPTPGGNSTGSNLVYYDSDPVNGVFTATWDDVGYYSNHTDKRDAFQLQLVDRGPSSSGQGENFDIVFRYEDINWTTGDASGGSGGLGGTIAQTGWYSPGPPANYYLIPNSGDQNSMLTLDTRAGNTGVAGLYIYQVRDGRVTNATSGSPDAGYGVDAPGFGSNSTLAIQTGQTYASRMDFAGDVDMYSFVAPTTGAYQFSSSGNIDVAGATFTSPNLFSISNYNDDISSSNRNFSMTTWLIGGQTYYAGVGSITSATGDYSFSINRV